MIQRLKEILPSSLVHVVCLLALQFSNAYAAEKSQSAEDNRELNQWQWSITKSSMLESTITITNSGKVQASYLVGCNLSDANKHDNKQDNELTDPPSLVEKFSNAKIPKGILLVSCHVGAHSRLIEVYDPFKESNNPVFSRVGSYYAGWRIEQEQLFLYFDQPCASDSPKTSKPSNCERFYEVSIKWPKKNS